MLPGIWYWYCHYSSSSSSYNYCSAYCCSCRTVRGTPSLPTTSTYCSAPVERFGAHGTKGRNALLRRCACTPGPHVRTTALVTQALGAVSINSARHHISRRLLLLLLLLLLLPLPLLPLPPLPLLPLPPLLLLLPPLPPLLLCVCAPPREAHGDYNMLLPSYSTEDRLVQLPNNTPANPGPVLIPPILIDRCTLRSHNLRNKACTSKQNRKLPWKKEIEHVQCRKSRACVQNRHFDFPAQLQPH